MSTTGINGRRESYLNLRGRRRPRGAHRVGSMHCCDCESGLCVAVRGGVVLRLMGSLELTRGGRGHGETERWLDNGSKRGGVRRAQMRVRIHEVRESPVGCASRCEGKGGSCLRLGSFGRERARDSADDVVCNMRRWASIRGPPSGTAPNYSPSPGAARPRAAEHVLSLSLLSLSLSKAEDAFVKSRHWKKK